MTTVRLEISQDTIVVRVPARQFSTTLANEITLRGRIIVGIGGVGIHGIEAARERDLVTSPAFEATNFDPILAEALTRWAIAAALKRSGIGWRHRFARPDLEIDWPAWGSVPAHRRQAFVESWRGFRFTVDGRPAIRPRVDLPFLRGAFGTRVDPGP